MQLIRTPRTSAARRRIAVVSLGVLVVALIPGLATAGHGLATLASSNFEIDINANLKNDDGGTWKDWADLAHPTGPELRATDLATGQNDNSYKGGVKEDTACPGETTGSIPNNKSDLLTFHVYEEAGAGTHPGFLNLAWSRVSDPSGTTLMDFEFNQSGTTCADSPNKLRTAGDLLIEYAIDQGGARADLTARTWSGSAWGAPLDIDAPSAKCPDGDTSNDVGGVDLGPCAVGTINSGAIPFAESDGLITEGQKDERTFGEAQVDLRLIFDSTKCTSFGSAMLKSRSSDAFTSQLKDFISPVGIDLKNCGKVIIRKQTDPDESSNTTQFKYTKSFGTDPGTSNNFQLTDDGVQTFNNVLFGSGYTVRELLGTDLPTGWDFVNVNCSASTGVTPTSIVGAVVTFAIDSETDILDCTYTNRARGTIIIEKVTSDGFGAFGFTSTASAGPPAVSALSPASWTLTTTAAGAGGKVSRTFSDLVPGKYNSAETVPTGWNLTSATCDDLSPVSAIDVSAGETVTCTFTNARERGAILITKTRKHAQATTPSADPHNGVTFTVTGGSAGTTGVTGVTGSGTNAAGKVCIDNLVVSSLAGNYTVTETVPTGYVALSTNPRTGVVVTEGTCSSGAVPLTFENMPLTNVTVSVDSQVNGGTASTIDCTPLSATGNDAVTGTNGDGSHTVLDLQPQTLVCEIVIDP